MRLSRGDQIAGLSAIDARELMRRFDDMQPESVIGSWIDSGGRTGAEVVRAKRFNDDESHLIDTAELVVFGSYLDPGVPSDAVCVARPEHAGMAARLRLTLTQ